MPRLILTNELCRNIVRSGSGNVYVSYQLPAKTRKRLTTLPGHRVGTITSGPDSSTGVFIVHIGDTEKTRPFQCTSPLTGGQTIPAGTKVIFQKNARSQKWEIIQAECF